MAASTLDLTYTELRRWIAREIGASRTPADFSTITSTDVGDALKRGLHRYYWPKLPDGSTHVWSFLKPTLAQLELHAPYTTGTVAVTSGVVTLSGGTFPTWAAQGEIWVDGQWSPVNTRDSNTQVTLNDTSITGISAGETYELIHREYDLPDDFGGLVDPFNYRSDTSDADERITTVNEALLRNADTYPRMAGVSTHAAITSLAPTSAQESKARALFWPTSDATRVVWYRYSVVPPMLEGSSYVYAHGGPQFKDALLASCLDMALQMLFGDASKHGDYVECMRSAIELDRRLNKPETLGFGAYSDGYSREYLDLRNDRRGWDVVGTINL